MAVHPLPLPSLRKSVQPANNAAFIIESGRQVQTLIVFGEVDLNNAQELADAMNPLVRAGVPLVVDLRACSYIDSSGLRVLIDGRSHAPSGFSIRALHGSSVHRVLQISNLAEPLRAQFEPGAQSVGA